MYLDARPLAVIESTGNPATAAFYFIHTDQLYIPQELTDAQQSPLWRADYTLVSSRTSCVSPVNISTPTLKIFAIAPLPQFSVPIR